MSMIARAPEWATTWFRVESAFAAGAAVCSFVATLALVFFFRPFPSSALEEIEANREQAIFPTWRTSLRRFVEVGLLIGIQAPIDKNLSFAVSFISAIGIVAIVCRSVPCRMLLHSPQLRSWALRLSNLELLFAVFCIFGLAPALMIQSLRISHLRELDCYLVGLAISSALSWGCTLWWWPWELGKQNLSDRSSKPEKMQGRSVTTSEKVSGKTSMVF